MRDAVRLELVHGERGARLRPFRSHRRHGPQHLHLSRVGEVAPHSDAAGAVAILAEATGTALRGGGALSPEELGGFDGVALGGPSQEEKEGEGEGRGAVRGAQHGRRRRRRTLQTINAMASVGEMNQRTMARINLDSAKRTTTTKNGRARAEDFSQTRTRFARRRRAAERVGAACYPAFARRCTGKTRRDGRRIIFLPPVDIDRARNNTLRPCSNYLSLSLPFLRGNDHC